MLSITHQLHTSSEGDILILDQPLTAGLFVGRDHVSTFCASPSTAPHYSFTRPIQVETFRLALEMGFAFSEARIEALSVRPELKDRPILRIVLAGRIHLLLVPTVLLPEDSIPLLKSDPELGLVVSHSLALPRGAASEYAVRLMARSFRRRRPAPDHS